MGGAVLDTPLAAVQGAPLWQPYGGAAPAARTDERENAKEQQQSKGTGTLKRKTLPPSHGG